MPSAISRGSRLRQTRNYLRSCDKQRYIEERTAYYKRMNEAGLKLPKKEV